jgi:hypothetical protein
MSGSNTKIKHAEKYAEDFDEETYDNTAPFDLLKDAYLAGYDRAIHDAINGLSSRMQRLNSVQAPIYSMAIDEFEYAIRKLKAAL